MNTIHKDSVQITHWEFIVMNPKQMEDAKKQEQIGTSMFIQPRSSVIVILSTEISLPSFYPSVNQRGYAW
jgi:hypothetical protein